MAKKRTRTRRKKARPLLLAAAGAALLFISGCETSSGNLLAPPFDLSVPDQAPPPDLKTRD